MKIFSSILSALLLFSATACADGIVSGGVQGDGLVGPPVISDFSPPEDTTTLLRNPGVGLQSTQQTESEANAAGSNPDGLPIPVANFRVNWIDVEGTQGVRSFRSLTDFLVKARADLQSVNYRLYETDPGSGVFAPTWVRTGTGLSGWTAGHDDTGGTGAWPCYDDADNRTAVNLTVQAMATAVAGYPAAGYPDQSFYGAYNEVNYSSTTYTNGSVVGVCPTPFGGAGNELPTPLPTPKRALADIHPTAYPNIATLTFADDQVYFDDAVTTGHAVRADGVGYRNVVANPALTPGSIAGNFQMGTAYRQTFASNYNTVVGPGDPTPTPIAAPTISAPNLWQTKPIVAETWNVLYPASTPTPGVGGSWEAMSYPYAASFQWMLDNHFSQLNTKGKFNPASSWDSSFRAMLKGLGYRHYISNINHPQSVLANSAFTLNTTWVNRGVAPNYGGQKVLFKFVKQGGSVVYKVSSGTTANWLPNVSTPLATSITLPTWVTAGVYTVYVGIGDGTSLIPDQQLAVTGTIPGDLWYNFTTVTVSNSSPTAAPTTDFAAGCAAASSQFLSLADNNPISMDGTDITGAIRVYVTSHPGSPVAIFSKGDLGATGQEYALFVSSSDSNQFKINISTASVIRSAIATNFGTVATGAWNWVVWKWDNTGKVLSIKVNNGTANTVVTTGSISNTTNAFRVCADTTGRFLNGRVDKMRIWKRLTTEQEDLDIYNSGSVLRLEDMTQAQKRGIFQDAEFDEVSGNRTGAFQPFVYVDNGGVTQVSAQ